MFVSFKISARQLCPAGRRQKEKPLQAFQAERNWVRGIEVLVALLGGPQKLGDFAIDVQQFRVLGSCCYYPGQKNAGHPHCWSELPPSTETGGWREVTGGYGTALSLPWPTAYFARCCQRKKRHFSLPPLKSHMNTLAERSHIQNLEGKGVWEM